MIDPAVVPVNRIVWDPCYRLIAWRFAPTGAFDRVANDEQLERFLAIESMTNDRLQDEIGEIQLVDPQERLFGRGATLIMSAFTHRNPLGSRFSSGDYGVYYCADSTDGALAEITYHQGIFLQRTREAPIEVDMRMITATLDARLHDLRELRSRAPELYDANSYEASQPFGAQLKEQGSWGVVYQSVRSASAQCGGIFRPRALRGAATAGHIAFHWDGQRITHWYEKGSATRISDTSTE